MSSVAIILLLLSALTNAGWNFISKRDHPTLSFYLVANVFGTLCVLPILFYFRSYLGMDPSVVWSYVTVSGFCLAVYMAFLAGAYRYGDLSIAYPIARSLPVVMVTAGAITIGRDAVPGWLYFIGMILVVAGCILLPLASIRARRGLRTISASSHRQRSNSSSCRSGMWFPFRQCQRSNNRICQQADGGYPNSATLHWEASSARYLQSICTAGLIFIP